MQRTCFLLIVFSLYLLVAPLYAQENQQLPAEVYSTPGPHVVVNGVLLKAPVQQSNGALLLPMRAVFEALQAQVRWFPSAQQITATRGATTVQLWINRRIAIVDDKEITLGVPPMLVGDNTYVPLRFPAEAFGGEVKWNKALQTAVITLATAAEIPPAIPTPVVPAAVPPLTPPVVKLNEATGVLMGKTTDVGKVLLFQDGANGDLTAVQVTPALRLTRGAVDAPALPADFATLQPGDLLKVTHDAAGKVIAVQATYLQVTGKVAAIANNKLLLQDGTLYQLHAEVKVVDADGKPVALTAIGNGSPVTLQLTPGTTTVWVIKTTTAPASLTPLAPLPAQPSILTVAPLNYTNPLKAGETLTIQVVGAAGADKVTARVGDLIPDVTLVEQEPGKYQQKVAIVADTNGKDLPIIANLRLGNQQAPETRSAQLVTIDTVAPVFNALLPAQDTQLFDRNPTISAAFDDPGGSGIDVGKVRITVHGVDVTKSAVIAAQGLSYQAANLPPGASVVRIEIADRAGNNAVAEWKLNVAAETHSPAVISLTQDATRPLTPGQTVKLTAKLALIPTRLEWYLGNKLVSQTVERDAATQTYSVSYQIAPTDTPGANRVSLRCFTDATQSQLVFADKPLVIAVAPKDLAIITPADKVTAPLQLTVMGVALPGTQVRVTVNYQSQVLFARVQGSVYKGTLTTGPDGGWSTPQFDTSVPLVTPDSYTISAESLDAKGTVMQRASITLGGR